jgi:hypothetical protein
MKSSAFTAGSDESQMHHAIWLRLMLRSLQVTFASSMFGLFIVVDSFK